MGPEHWTLTLVGALYFVRLACDHHDSREQRRRVRNLRAMRADIRRALGRR
jgi:hypothetical protein